MTHARVREPDLPEWLTEDLLFEALLECELRERGELPPEPEVPIVQEVTPLTLKAFVHEFWPVLEPGTPLRWGWALDAMCLHLEAVARRVLRKLIINVPPGTMKSSLTNVFFPAWVWAEVNPGERFLAVSYTESLSMRDSMNMRRLVTSGEYVERYGEKVSITRDQNAKGEYDTTARGRRAVRPITSATGARAGILLIDDPNNAAEIHSPAHRRTINNTYDQSLSRRGSDPNDFAQIVIMQRLHVEDLTGHLEAKGGWTVLRLPERFEPEHRTVTPLWQDPRSERGELLFPEYRDEAAVQDAEHDLGTYGTAGQLQQRPVPLGGGIVKRHWWRFHAPAALVGQLPPVRVRLPDGSEVEAVVIATPELFERQLTSWDMTFKDTKKSDFVVGGAWGARGADRFLLDQVRGQWAFVETKRQLLAFATRHPEIQEHVVEDKANGPAIIDELRSTIAGLIAWEPEGSKESRVHAESPVIEAGNVYLPHPALAPWVLEEYLPEWDLFPNGAKDDQVDMTTQALQRTRPHRIPVDAAAAAAAQLTVPDFSSDP